MKNKSTLYSLWWVVLVLIAVLGLAATAQAAGEAALTMDSPYYSVWPEFDEPQVLVSYSGTLVNDTGTPFQGEIRYMMPKGSRVFMVCETEKGMVCQPYEVDTTSNPDHDVVKWRLSRALQPGDRFPVMFEYYTGSFTGPGERKFSIPFATDFPVTNLTVEFREPQGAQGFALDPKPASSGQAESESGKKYSEHYFRFDRVEPGKGLNFSVAYTRDTAEPSEPKTDNQATNAGSPRGTGVSSTVVVLLVVFLLALGGVLFYAAQSGSRGGRPRRADRGRAHGGLEQRGRAGTGGSADRKRSQQAPSRSGQGTGRRSEPVVGGNRQGGGQPALDERKKIRKMLLDGRITEETYKQLMAELDREG